MSRTPSAVSGLAPAARLADREPYTSPAPPFPIDLWLNSNEGRAPTEAVLAGELEASISELVRRYPDVSPLQIEIAKRHGLRREQVLVTAGADDAICRACLAMLDRGREIVVPVPTFEMIERYARLAGGSVVLVDWLTGPYPAAAVVDAVTNRTAIIAVVSPNNPTGATASGNDLRRLSAAARGALMLVDLAYAEFAEEDLTRVALTLPNALVVRTFSKAWGGAGLRVGYALGPANVIRWLRTAGSPYSVSGLSAAIAAGRLRDGSDAIRALVARVCDERSALSATLCDCGAEPLPSQANFVLARFSDAAVTWTELARCGIAVRAFPGHPQLDNYLRITCPGEPVAFRRLLNALRQCVCPTE